MSGHIIEIITTKINKYFTQKYPLNFHKIGLSYPNLIVLVERLFSREGKDISSLSKIDIRIKMENLIKILETKIKTKLELELELELEQKDQNLVLEQPNNYYNSNKVYKTDSTSKYEESFNQSMKKLEDMTPENPKTSEVGNYKHHSNTDILLKERYYPEEMKYETRPTMKLNIKINSKNRKISIYPSPSNIVFNFNKDAPLIIEGPVNTNTNTNINDKKDDNLSLEKGEKKSKEKGEKGEKLDDINEVPSYNFVHKIKTHKNNQELEVNSDKLLGNSIIPINLNEVVSLKVSSIILFDKYMLYKRPNPYLLLQIPELTKEIASFDNSQVIGGDNNILTSIVCLDDYRIMNGYRFYQNLDCQSIKFETPRNIDKLTFQLINPNGEEVTMSPQMNNTPETVVQYSLELEVFI